MPASEDSRNYNIGICVFSVSNVLLIAFIAVTPFYVFTEKKSIDLNDADICVPCEDLRLHPDDIIEGIKRRGKNKTICCIEDEVGPDAFVGYYIDHWLKKNLATEDREYTRYKCGENGSTEKQKPNIKLVGRNEIQTAGHHKLHWDGENEMAIVPDDGSITHHKEHGFIEIKMSGLYQVYSQVVLDHDKNAQNHNAPDIYEHYVILIEAKTRNHKTPREITILRISNSHCECKANKQTITSYLGAAFHLSEGDKLAVKSHNKTEVVPVPHMNFFGAYML